MKLDRPMALVSHMAGACSPHTNPQPAILSGSCPQAGLELDHFATHECYAVSVM